MTHFHSSLTTAASLIAATLLLGACAGPAPSSAPRATGAPGKQQVHLDFDGGLAVDYQLERKISTVNNKSCYAFITGSLTNGTARTLSERTIIDFTAIEGGKMLFRDITNPVGDIPPGATAGFNIVDAPVHRDGCPNYDQIDVALRPVYAN